MASDWQLIETAPKDGTRVLVAWAHRTVATPNPTIATSLREDGWASVTGGVWRGSYAPTHWMPLPAPPKALGVSE